MATTPPKGTAAMPQENATDRRRDGNDIIKPLYNNDET
jgi:hypothetical protein